MSIGIVMKQVIADGCGDFAGNLRAAWAVEVRDRMAVVLTA